MKGTIRWFVENQAVANLLMVLLIGAGLYALPNTRQETLPNVPLDRISVTTRLAQATPETAERLLCVPLENALYAIEGLTDLISEAYEGLCSIRVDVADGYDTGERLEEVKSAVDRVDSLPEDASIPQVTELVVRNRVARLVLSGDHDDLSLYHQAVALRRQLLASGSISVVDIENIPPREINIAVTRDDLRRHGIRLGEMAAEIRHHSDARGSGVLHSGSGDLLLETGKEPAVARDFLALPVRRGEPGEVLRVRDIAQVQDGFAASRIAAWYDDRPAISLDIYRVGNQHVLEVVDAVKAQAQMAQLPPGMHLELWQDDAEQFRSRFELLKNGAVQGLLILAVLLCLFLGLRLAVWVALGIPVAMLGAVSVLPLAGESINTISLFAFILVLGVVVDDAIIVGESVHGLQRRGVRGSRAAIQGATRVARPLVYAVFTTLIAFTPLLFLPGAEGALMRVIPLVAMAILLLSLVESLWILPSHLGSGSQKSWPGEAFFERVSLAFNTTLDQWLARIYRPLMSRLLDWRMVVVAVFFALFFLCLALVHSGWLNMVLFSRVEADQVVAEVMFPQGTSSQRIHEAVVQLRESATQLRAGGEDPVVHVLAEQGVSQKVSNARDPDAPYRVRVTLKLAADSEVAASELARQWRAIAGVVPGATAVRFDASLVQTKPDIHINLFHDELDTLEKMSRELQWLMAGYQGVHEVANSLAAQRSVVELVLRPRAEAVGIDQESLAQQVGQAFHGIEVDRVAEHEKEVPVMLRLARDDARTWWDLQELPVQLPNGEWSALGVLAEISMRETPATISHYQRRRNATVTALVDERQNSVGSVMATLQADFLDTLPERFPGASWGIAGKPKAVAAFLEYLNTSYMLALCAMFFLLTVLFANYHQPLLVMTAIPFGIVGAFLGHFLLGHEVTLWSMVGVVAVSGVVVNDNLVLIDAINIFRREGMSLREAVLEAGQTRFRPVMLTSLTTFAGMAPLIIDNALAARFLVPMAVSLAFGVLFATLVSLILVPALMLVGCDVRKRAVELYRHGLRRRHAASPASESDSVEAAYRAGALASGQGEERTNPYDGPELWAAWEAGYAAQQPPPAALADQ